MLKAMSIATKQHSAGVVSLLCAISMVFCISRMIPYALSDETGKLKLWFGLMVASLVISLPASIFYYYFRGKLRTSSNLDRLHVEVDTLSKLDQQHTRSKTHES